MKPERKKEREKGPAVPFLVEDTRESKEIMNAAVAKHVSLLPQQSEL